MSAKARCQILALLLTIAHFYNGNPGILSSCIETILNMYSAGEYETAKDLADFLNNLECMCND